MPPRNESDEKYILDLVAEVLAEPTYRWQHRFPTLLGDPGRDGKRRPLPVDGYFPRHKLIFEYWESQHSAPVPIMDEGMTVSGVSRGHQRRLYDQRRQTWARANGLQLVILDHRGFETNAQGRLQRNRARDRQIVATALRSAGVLHEPDRIRLKRNANLRQAKNDCFVCRLIEGDPSLAPHHIIWRGPEAIAFLDYTPTVFGSAVVSPLDHREQVTGDSSLHQYLALQRIVFAVAEAVRSVLSPERVYILSLGSQQANAHVCWHIVPCPPETPFDEQQLSLLDAEAHGTVQMRDEYAEELITLLRSQLPAWMQARET